MPKWARNSLYGWYKLRWEILCRDNFTCQYCGQSAPNVRLEVDHKIPVAEGGTNDKDNLTTSCWACNRGKEGLRQSIALKALNKERRMHQVSPPITFRERIIALLSKSENKEGLLTPEIAARLEAHLESIQVILFRMRRRHIIDKQGKKWLLIT